MKVILSLIAAMAFTVVLGFACFLLLKTAMYKELDKKERRKLWLQIFVLMLVIAGSYCVRRIYTDYKHPYKDLDIIGTWDYGYSVAFGSDEKMTRADKDLFSMEMHTETEIVLNDDGSFRIVIEDTSLTGTWTPDDYTSDILHLNIAEPDMSAVVTDNEVRWDKGEDKLCIGLAKDNVPDNLKNLFVDDEEYRYIFCKTYRNNVRTVYIEKDEEYEDDEWEDNGLPFNYHP